MRRSKMGNVFRKKLLELICRNNNKNYEKIYFGINLPIKARCHESGVALIDQDGKVILPLAKKVFRKTGR